MTKPVYIKDVAIGEGLPKICVPVMGETLEDLCRETKAAKEARAGLVEWRADFFQNIFQPDAVKEVLDSLGIILGGTPLIFTVRTKEEGGNLEVSINDYIELLKWAADTQKADLIDVEFFKDTEEMPALIEELHKRQCLVIASNHDFSKTDKKEVLKERFLQMDKSGADILKMAVMPKEFEDVAAIMQVTSEVSKTCTDKPLISMAMGTIGSISRIAGENFGSSVTFGCLGKASAPGQFPIEELRTMMEALHKKNTDTDKMSK